MTNNEKLEKAISKNNISKVQKYLDKGADPNYQGLFTSILFRALIGREQRKIEIAILLIKALDHIDEELLYHAIYHDSPQILEVLLDRDEFNPNVVRGGKPLIFHTIGLWDAEMLRVMLAKGADIHATDAEGNSLLHESVTRSSSLHEIELLIAAGIDVNTVNDAHETPLHKCFPNHGAEFSKKDREKAAVLLKSGADLNVADNNGITPRQKIFQAGASASELVKLAIQQGAKLDPADDEGSSLLHQVVTLDPSVTRTLLLKSPHKFNVCARDKDGLTPLHHAVRSLQIENIKLLLQKKAAVNATDNSGKTPLHDISFHGTNRRTIKSGKDRATEVALILLHAGANINAVDHKGNTPLHYSTTFGTNLTLIKCLTAYGANIHATNKEGQTYLNLVERKFINTPLPRAFGTSSKRFDNDLRKISRRSQAIIQGHFKYGLFPNVDSEKPSSPVHTGKGKGKQEEKKHTPELPLNCIHYIAELVHGKKLTQSQFLGWLQTDFSQETPEEQEQQQNSACSSKPR